MKEYMLSEFLEAAKSFAKQPGAQEHMETILREKESARQGMLAKDITIVSETSIGEAINELTVYASQLYIAIMSKFSALGYKALSKIPSHFAFGEHWNELPAYAGYVPEDKQWSSIKDEFYVFFKHNNENPKFLLLKRGEEQLPVYVYGFKVPYVCLGTGAAVNDRVALCKIVSTKECVAIAW